MTIEDFKSRLRDTPTAIAFSDTMTVIDANYDFMPTAFSNGSLENKAGENSGSCKLFAFAKMQGFTNSETLACFGAYYFDDVLKDPNGDGHQNIRNFMKNGIEGLSFAADALKKK